MIPTTLVVGLGAHERELAIKNRMAILAEPLVQSPTWGILSEGFCHGNPVLSENENTLIFRIAAGCICCSNRLIMRIYLNRLIQQAPDHLFLSISTESHLEQIKQFLTTTAYRNTIELTPDLLVHH